MLRSRRNIGKHNLACCYGCCRHAGSKRAERRRVKRAEAREWKREVGQ